MATLNELLPLLAEHSAILVTGPQRSGTTIAARILAVELGRRYADEVVVEVSNSVLAAEVLAAGDVVLQAPALCHVAHNFGCAVVLMRRDLHDILRSQHRIGWDWREPDELRKYGMTEGPVAAVKYRSWDEWQRDKCEAAYELDYESLRDHPLWVQKNERIQFGSRQWKP